MKVFVTGATGFVGSAVVPELIAAGHQVLGLARSDASAKSLAAAGAQVHRGDLQDLDSLKKGAAASDGVIHLAFIHDFTKFKENCEIERRAVEATGSVLAGSGKPFIISSGTGLVSPGRVATEDTVSQSGPNAIPRVVTEETAVAMASRGVRTVILRLPPSVHGDGDHGFVPRLIALAREKGVSAYLGEGRNVWAGVHRLDAARLYRLALEKGEAGSRYHAVAEESVPFRDIAEVIGRRLQVPVVSVAPEKGAEHFGWFAHFAAMNVPASSKKTRELLGWVPNGPGLIADIDQPNYFAN
jgi:nucleoside-diphosphate-sugar epimerase